jgi:phage gp36-like protein
MAEAPGAYASSEDVKARYAQDVIDRICWDPAGDPPDDAPEGSEAGGPDYTKLDRALIDAAGEINSYISARYPVPVDPAPILLRNINVDLALYATALTADKMFDELAVRAENWRKHLVMIATGKAGLGVTETQSDTDSSPAAGTNSSSGMSARSVRVN